MAKCKRCNRELKNHTQSGMGEICRMKASRHSESETAKKVRVEPLFIRRQMRRSYLVFTRPRQTVVVTENETGRFASCGCSDGDALCEHISIVARIDRERFPQDVAELQHEAMAKAA